MLLVLMLLGSQHMFGQQTIGYASCGATQGECHASENNWYKDDAHKKSLNTLEVERENSEKYAEALGIAKGDLFDVVNVCMDCHGTAVSGRKEVEDGVSCESCHGPGKEYKEPHSVGKGGGVSRQGYVEGIKRGMKPFKTDKNEVAMACVRCHYITDDRLITEGHSDGTDFRYASKIEKVAKHWKQDGGPDDLKPGDFSKDLFEKAKKAKSGKQTAILPDPPPKLKEKQTQVVVQNNQVSQTVQPTPPPESEPPNIVTTPISVGPISLPAFPSVTDSTRLDSLLLILKQRLELLYQKVR